jgi:hypothetical protein
MSDEKPPADDGAPPDDGLRATANRHFRYGWWGLFLFAALGLVLESLNGMRVGWYLDVSNEARRTMFRLAHAHGTLLSLINVMFALSLQSRFGKELGAPRVPSACLLAALILLPAGFFTGGLVIYDADPGLGVMLVPVGALLFIVAALLLARSSPR